MKNLKILFLAIGVSLLSTACLVDDEDQTLDDMSSTPYAIGWINETPAISYFEDLGTVQEQVYVDIIGGNDGGGADSDITVNYTINEDMTTAQEGVEFDFTGTAGTIIIPEGEKFGTLTLDVHTGNFNPTEATQLVLDVTNVSDNSLIVEDNKQVVIQFVGCLADIDQYNYQMVTVRLEDGAIVAQGTESFTMLDINSFRSESVGPFGANGQFGAISPPALWDGYNCTIVCGNINIPEQNLGGYYSNLIWGVPIGEDPNVHGTVDVATGNIEVTYIASYQGDKIYKTTYTRL